MAENMAVWVEVWPVAADQVGLWLLSGGDAWRPGLPVPSDSEPHAEVELELAGRAAKDSASLLHSTSWRVDGPRVILTYIAVVEVTGLVRDQWPDALPIDLALAEAVGRPPTNAANDAPAPRYVDVLLHALRHLRFLIDYDATAAEALTGTIRGHLLPLAPALAGMYGERHLSPSPTQRT
ncbi:hypothetical protein [Micromonospora sp. CA-111912]|uniref:hypothetical protein n=1 Tax=Micromonospora sp. CA-111912 TaxID=3239955 RepID=UPI003D8B7646